MSSDKDDELSLDENLEELELGDLSESLDEGPPGDDGLDLSLSDDFDDHSLSLSDEPEAGDDFSLGDAPEEGFQNLGELDLGEIPDLSLDSEPVAHSETPMESVPDSSELSLNSDFDMPDLSLESEASIPATPVEEKEDSGQFSLSQASDLVLEDSAIRLDGVPDQMPDEVPPVETFSESDSSGVSFSLGDESELSEEVKEKLKEIDAIMDGSSKIDIKAPQESFVLKAEDIEEADLEQSLVSDDINVDELDFTIDESSAPKTVAREEVVEAAPAAEKPKRKKKESRDEASDIREISGAYTGELERMQATISNLRADREELLAKIQNFEDEQILQRRQTLSLRAELDEKKIELSIIRRKLNDEVAELKDSLRIHDEKRLILEEKNRALQQELEKAGQRTKLDIKKVQMRERELEQKLELLKADAETQIRNRDLKILELKRKIDAMEFDMESITTQEKKSVESRFELEDKLDKAIKTLRSAITVLEEEGRSSGLEALKKNIDV